MLRAAPNATSVPQLQPCPPLRISYGVALSQGSAQSPTPFLHLQQQLNPHSPQHSTIRLARTMRLILYISNRCPPTANLPPTPTNHILLSALDTGIRSPDDHSPGPDAAAALVLALFFGSHLPSQPGLATPPLLLAFHPCPIPA